MFEQVTIVGVGLLGASLGLALKERKLAGRIVGVGRAASDSLRIAHQRGAIDEPQTDLAAAAAGSDLVVLCTPIRQFPALLQQIAPVLKAGAMVTDVGSTKADVMRWAARYLPASKESPGSVFVGSHPMAGSEKRGPEHARVDLYQSALCLLVAQPNPRGEGDSALDKIQAMWQGIGMRTLRLEAREHDRWVATVSHLPHAVAFALANAMGRHPEMFPAAAGGLLDTTRIAASDSDMWTDIFLTNRKFILESLGEMQGHLAELKKAIRGRDEPAIRAALARAKAAREALVREKSKT